MKNFLSIENFKELKILFILEFIIIALSLVIPWTRELINTVSLFNLNALIISFVIWILCSLLDSKSYFNLANLIASIIFIYGIFWFLFSFLN